MPYKSSFAPHFPAPSTSPQPSPVTSYPPGTRSPALASATASAFTSARDSDLLVQRGRNGKTVLTHCRVEAGRCPLPLPPLTPSPPLSPLTRFASRPDNAGNRRRLRRPRAPGFLVRLLPAAATARRPPDPTLIAMATLGAPLSFEPAPTSEGVSRAFGTAVFFVVFLLGLWLPLRYAAAAAVAGQIPAVEVWALGVVFGGTKRPSLLELLVPWTEIVRRGAAAVGDFWKWFGRMIEREKRRLREVEAVIGRERLWINADRGIWVM